MIRANSTSSELNVLGSQYYCLLNNPRSLLSRQMVRLHFLTFFLLNVIMATNLVGKWNANHSDLAGIKFCQLQVRGLRASMWLPTSSLLCYMILEDLHIDGKPQSASVTTMRRGILTNGCIHTHTLMPIPTVDIENPWYINLTMFICWHFSFVCYLIIA